MLKITLSSLLALAALFALAHLVGASRWRAGTTELRLRLENSRLPGAPEVVDFGELEGLPEPVQRNLRAVLVDGQPIPTGARFRHTGTFDMGEDAAKWRAFTSDQRVVIHRPGLDWDGRIAMAPGLPVRVHDAYLAGEGILHASVLGLFTVSNLRGGGDLAHGELMRFLAESPWYPTRLLPGAGVAWSAVDARSADASLRDGDLVVTLRFRFGDDGLIASVGSEARGRLVDGTVIPTPWQGRFWNYAERGGMLVPLDGEVEWILPSGPRPYWRGHLTSIEYEFAP